MKRLKAGAWIVLGGALLATPALADPTATPAVSDETTGEEGEEAAQPAAAPAAPAAESKEGEGTEGDAKKDPAKPVNRALADVVQTAGAKAWRLNITLEQTLGAGALVKDEFARTPAYGYAVSLNGSYRLHPMLSVNARVDFDQQLTTTNGDLGTFKNEFYFREVRLGATSRFFTEEVTGIGFGALLSFRLPTDKAAMNTGRVLGIVGGLNASKTFSELGPGDLSILLSSSFRKNFAPAVQTGDPARDAFICRSVNATATGECVTNFANSQYSFSNGVNLNYSIGNFSLMVDFTISNVLFADLSNTTIPSTIPGPVSTSPNAISGANQLDWMFGTIEASYQTLDWLGFALGVTTGAPPFIQRGNEPNGLRFPFFDFESTANNFTTFYFDVNFTI